MYRNYGLYLLKHFVIALPNVCTVKMVQLDQLIRFKSTRLMICPARVKSHHTWEKHFSILLDNSFVKLPGSNPKVLEKTRTLFTSLSMLKQGKTNMNHNA